MPVTDARAVQVQFVSVVWTEGPRLGKSSLHSSDRLQGASVRLMGGDGRCPGGNFNPLDEVSSWTNFFAHCSGATATYDVPVKTIREAHALPSSLRVRRHGRALSKDLRWLGREGTSNTPGLACQIW